MDILDIIGIRLPGATPDQFYEVPLRDILMSHDMLEQQGCVGAQETECPPIFQVFLANSDDIAQLQQAWQRLEERARKDGGELVLINREPARPAPHGVKAA